MMGFRDPTDLEYEAERWDEFIKEFGVAAYIEMRYQDAIRDRVCNVYDSSESWSAAVDSYLEVARKEYREALDRLADC
jgi:hypothetical protein